MFSVQLNYVVIFIAINNESREKFACKKKFYYDSGETPKEPVLIIIKKLYKRMTF